MLRFKLITFFLLVIIWAETASAQVPFGNYEYHLEEGIKENKLGNFELATTHLMVAGIGPDMTPDKVKLILDELTNVIDRWGNYKDSINQITIEQKREAIGQGRLLRALVIADEAQSDLRNGRDRNSIIKSYYAYNGLQQKDTTQLLAQPERLSESTWWQPPSIDSSQIIPPSVYLSYGNAVTHYFADSLTAIKGNVLNFTHDNSGNNLIVLGEDSIARILHLSSQELIYEDTTIGQFRRRIDWQEIGKSGQADYCYLSAISPDGQIALVNRQEIKIKDANGGTKIIPLSKTRLEDLIWIDEDHLLTASQDNKIQRWNIHSLSSEDVISNAGFPFKELQLSPDRSFCLARTMRSVYFFDLSNAEAAVKDSLVLDELMLAMQITQNGKQLIISTGESKIVRYEIVSGAFKKDDTQFIDGHVLSIKSNESATGLLLPTTKGEALLLEDKDTLILNRLLGQDSKRSLGMTIAINENGKRYAIGWQDTVVVFSNQTIIDTIYLNKSMVTQLAFSPKMDDLLLVGTQSGRIILMDIHEKQPLIDTRLSHGIEKMTFDQSGHHIYLMLSDHQIISIPNPVIAFNTFKWQHLLTDIKEVVESLQRELKDDLGL